MPRNLEIDFVRQAILQTIRQEYIKNPTKYIGSENDLQITSFYEHLQSNENVDRYVNYVRELTNQQNRVGLRANGVITAPTTPTITNLNQCTIIPMDFTLNVRTTIEDIEQVKDTLDNVVAILKGRKFDIAELDSGDLFMVGTLGNNINGKPLIRNGDFIGILPNTTPATTINTFITNRQSDLVNNYGFESEVLITVGSYLYYEEQSSGKLKVAVLTSDNGWQPQVESEDYQNIIFPPQHNSFTKWKVSLAFDSFRLSEPRQLNSKDYVDLSFGGSATLTTNNVVVGNELTKVGIKRLGYYTQSGLYNTGISDSNYQWVEPLELPSGNSASTIANQLMSNKFTNNSHTDGLTLDRQYTFVLDKDIEIIKEWFKYARFGTQTYITPNMIYEVRELYSCWGEVEKYDCKFKIVESIDIENTESDTLTLTIPFQLQGDNN